MWLSLSYREIGNNLQPAHTHYEISCKTDSLDREIQRSDVVRPSRRRVPNPQTRRRRTSVLYDCPCLPLGAAPSFSSLSHQVECRVTSDSEVVPDGWWRRFSPVVVRAKAQKSLEFEAGKCRVCG